MNSVHLIGRLANQPETRQTKAGDSVTNFRVAVDGFSKDQTDFFNVVAWKKTGEVVANYFNKGRQIGIEGRLQQRAWETDKGEKRSTVEVVANRVFFCGAPTERESVSADFIGSKSESSSQDNLPF